jgi:hypothetical protein
MLCPVCTRTHREARILRAQSPQCSNFPGPALAVPAFETLRKTDMKTQANQPLHLPLLSGTMTALLVSGIVIASLAISAQGFDGVMALARPPEAVEQAGAAPVASKCAECGVIESMRRIDAPDEQTVGSYAITIRLQDGSMRTITDTHPAKWRQGERVTLIGAAE